MNNVFSLIYCHDSSSKLVFVRSHYRLENGKIELVQAIIELSVAL
ncbi:hypothetical protein [Dysgonomonas capnocytophagoides]